MRPMQIIKNGFRIAAHNKRIILYLLFAALPTAVLELLSSFFFAMGEETNALLVLPGLLLGFLALASAVLLVPPLTLGSVYTQSRAVDRLVDPQAGYRFKDIFRYLRSGRFTRGLYPLVFSLMTSAVAAAASFIFFIGVFVVTVIFGAAFYDTFYQLDMYRQFYGYIPDSVLESLINPGTIAAVTVIVLLFFAFLFLVNTFVSYLGCLADAITAMEDSLRVGDVLRTVFACYRKGFRKHVVIGLFGSALLVGGTIVYLFLLIPAAFMQDTGAAVYILVFTLLFCAGLIFVQLAMQLSSMLLLKQQREAEPGLFLPPPPVRPFYPGYPGQMPPQNGMNLPGGYMPGPNPPYGGLNGSGQPPVPPRPGQGGYNPPPIVPPSPRPDSSVPEENPLIQEVPVEPKEQNSSEQSSSDQTDSGQPSPEQSASAPETPSEQPSFNSPADSSEDTSADSSSDGENSEE